MRRSAILALVLVCPAMASSQNAIPGTIVIVVGAEATAPVPTLSNLKANTDVADLMFLRLARIGPDFVTAGDRGFTPELAQRWTRRDSLTLVFELDPRARWHDGRPVNARDVVFSFDRIRRDTADAQKTVLLRSVSSVTAEGERTVVVGFSRVYAEQFYDAVWHVQPLPAHLLDTIPKGRLAASPFVQHPIGNGPYRFSRREPGRQVELVANPDFFLGRPGLGRVVFLLARDAEAQINLMLDGTGDALESIIPVSNVPRVKAKPDLRILAIPTTGVGYLLFNQRAYGDRGQPHPILADVEVRRALSQALDRRGMTRATFGDWAAVPEGPVSQLHWIREPGVQLTRHDPAGARMTLERRGWRDSDGDGILDRNGQPLSLRLNFPGTSAPRVMLAQQVQEQWRRIGVQVELVRLDGPVWAERRAKGEFDIDFAAASLDPSPSGMVQSWSCAGRGGSNVAQYCNPVVDSLLDAAIAGRGDTRLAWREVVRRLVDDAPAVFLYAPSTPLAIHTRYERVAVSPESYWRAIWRWRVRPGRELPRDRVP
ncbi:MAG TPA: peptide ABC transporter substrate-binding protein [Gemmatimonadales bacterium]